MRHATGDDLCCGLGLTSRPCTKPASLARRMDKWRGVEARLVEAGFRNYHRLEAVNGRNISFDEVTRSGVMLRAVAICRDEKARV